MLEIVFLGLQIQQWIVIAVIIATFLTLMLSDIKPEAVFLCTIMVFFLTGVLTLEEGFKGMTSSSVIVVGLLFLVIAGMKYTGALAWMMHHLAGHPKSYAGAIIRLMLPATLISAFASNTATTQLFQEAVHGWSKKLNLSPSQLLLPLTYATSFGGLLTTIGSPNNLVIASIYTESTGKSMNIFAPMPIGLCCLAAGCAIIVLCRRLFPVREAPELDNTAAKAMEFPTTKRTYISFAIMGTMIIVSAFDLISLPACCFLAALAMILCKCCNIRQAEREVNWNILLVFAGSISIGTAVHKVGLDELVVEHILSFCGTNPYIVLGVICLVASLCTELLSDTACAALFCPIALQAASQLGLNPFPFCIAIMFAVSNNYSTPIATPANMLVYMSGGYKFTDFARVGLILKLSMIVLTISIIPLIYPFAE